MKKLDNAQITSKAVEISKCLVGTASGLVTHDLGVTRTVGDAARLALTVRQKGLEISRDTLAAVSTALRIDSMLTESYIVPLFDDLGWWEVKRKGHKVLGVVERIPPVVDVLDTLGQEWSNRGPTGIEEASVKALSVLSDRPFEKQALLSELDATENDLDAALTYGDQAQYLGKFTSKEYGSETIWTPHFWARNADKVQRFLEKQNEPGLANIAQVKKEFSKYPGRPLDQIQSSETLNAGIANGFFPTGRVEDRKGRDHVYVFPPAPEFGLEPKDDIFEKARMIVSCIRHGQFHAEITQIKYPLSILHAMRTNQMRPHSYARIQYAILVLNKIVRPEEVAMGYGTGWRIIFNDTPENQLAADIAKQMLQGQTPVPVAHEEAEARQVLAQGTYSYSAEQRKLKAGKKILAKDEFDRLMELVGSRGN